MDPIICCLLEICCSPLQQQEKLASHFETLGASPDAAREIAKDLVGRFTGLLKGPFLANLIDAARKHRD